MRRYLADRIGKGIFTPEEIDVLADVCQRASAQLAISQRDDIDLITIRILVLYDQGIVDTDEIVRMVVQTTLGEKQGRAA